VSPGDEEVNERTNTMTSTGSSSAGSPITSSADIEKIIVRELENSESESAAPREISDPEKEVPQTSGSSTPAVVTHHEKVVAPGTERTSRHRLHRIHAGRPDAASQIREAISSTPSNQRVLVAACGPEGLMRVVRDTTASLIRPEGPAVEMHCEQFGW
jgi:hypothetical protein